MPCPDRATSKRTDESFKTIQGRAFKTIHGACARAAAPNLESINGDKVNNTGLNVHIKRNLKVRAVCLFLKLPTETTCMTLPTSGPLCNAALLLKFIIYVENSSRRVRMQHSTIFFSASLDADAENMSAVSIKRAYPSPLINHFHSRHNTNFTTFSSRT